MASVDTATKIPFLYRFLINPEFRIGRYAVLLVTLAVIVLNITFFSYRENIFSVGNHIYGVGGILFLTYLVAIGFNLHVLVPRFLLKKKYGLYICLLAVAVILTIGVQTYLEYFGHKYWNLSGNRGSYLNWVSLFDMLSGFVLNSICFVGSAMPILFRHWIGENRRMGEIEQIHLRTEVNNLKEQVDPHLLLNVLHRTGTLASSADSANASVLLMKLSQILRYQLYDCNRNYVSLNSEIRFMADYLQLGQLCHDRLQYTLNPTGPIAMIVVPPLLFIPFIRYAIEDVKTEKIDIELNVREQTVDFTCRYSVMKNMPVGDLQQVRQRLTLLYKDGYHLSADAPGLIQLQLKMHDDAR